MFIYFQLFSILLHVHADRSSGLRRCTQRFYLFRFVPLRTASVYKMLGLMHMHAFLCFVQSAKHFIKIYFGGLEPGPASISNGYIFMKC